MMSRSHKEMLEELEADYKLEPHYEAYHNAMDVMFNGVFDDIDKLSVTDSKPKHYQIGIDTFERMRANATLEEAMGFIRWNIDKYNTRKKGQEISDYKKIKDYCDEAIWWLENEAKQ